MASIHGPRSCGTCCHCGNGGGGAPHVVLYTLVSQPKAKSRLVITKSQQNLLLHPPPSLAYVLLGTIFPKGVCWEQSRSVLMD